MRTYVVTNSQELEQAYQAAEDGSQILLAAGAYDATVLEGRDFQAGLRIASLDPADRAVFTDQLKIVESSGLLVEQVDVIADEIAPTYTYRRLLVSGVADSTFRDIRVQGHVPTAEEGADPNADYSTATSAPTRLAGYGYEMGAIFKGERLTVENVEFSDLKWALTLGGTDVTARNLDIHDVREGVQLATGRNITIEDSHFHGFKPWMGPNTKIGDHPDMIQYWGDNRVAGDDFDGIRIRGNVFHYEAGVAGQMIFGHMRYSDGGAARNFDVSDNLLVGNILRGISLEGVEGARIDGNVLLPDHQVASDSWIARILLENTTGAVVSNNVQVRIWPSAGDALGNVKLALTDPSRGELWTDWLAEIGGVNDASGLVAAVAAAIRAGAGGAELVSALQTRAGLASVALPTLETETLFGGAQESVIHLHGDQAEATAKVDFARGDLISIEGLAPELAATADAADAGNVLQAVEGELRLDGVRDLVELARIEGIDLVWTEQGAVLTIAEALRGGEGGDLHVFLPGLAPEPTVAGPGLAVQSYMGLGAFDIGEVTAALEAARDAPAAKLRGADGADLLTGTGSDDAIDGRGGDDVVFGGEGRDELRGAAGSDILVGGEGRDALLGGQGDDFLFGEAGNDLFRVVGRFGGGRDVLGDVSFDERDSVYLSNFAEGAFDAARGHGVKIWVDGDAALIDEASDLAALALVEGIDLAQEIGGVVLHLDAALLGRAGTADLEIQFAGLQMEDLLVF